MLLGLSILVLSVSYLIYRHPTGWNLFSSKPEQSTPKRLDDTPTPPSVEDERPAERPAEKDNDRIGSIQEKDDQGLALDGTSETESDVKSSSQETTPKATASDGPEVPTFSLESHESSDEEDNLPPPSFPAINSAQRASAGSSLAAPARPSMAPPPRPNPAPNRGPPTSSSLMPPPSIKSANLRALPNTPTNSLRVPSTGPLPNRNPAQSNGSLGVPPSLSAPGPKPRAKQILKPGHSPLDWANLQRSGKNLSGVNGFIRVTPSMLKQMNGRKGKPAWSSWQGKVYNITPYVPFHPGGAGELLRAAGKDGTKLFMEVHPWVNWENMLGECLVGIMVAETEEKSPLDEMD